MRKLIIVILILLCLGCSKEEYMLCEFSNVDKSQNYESSITYKIYYDNDKVKKINIEEIYISPDESVRNYFNEYRKIYYYDLHKKYDEHIYKSEEIDEKLIINVDIDYNDVDMKKMIKDKYIDVAYTKGGYLTKNGAKLFYEEKGAKCEVK